MAEAVQLEDSDRPPGGGADWSNQAKAAGEKPDGVPDKFWNAEKGEVDSTSLMASYVELERKLGEAAPADTLSPPSPPTTSTPEATPPTESEGFSIGKYEDEYRENGDALNEDTYSELQTKFGLEKEEVNKYIQYRQQEANTFAQEIFGMVGGEDAYQSLIGWASNTLPKTEVDRLNSVLETAEKDSVRVEILKLNNKYRDSVGAEPISPVAGSTTTNSTGPKPFASLQEAVEARKDKKFDLDPAYRTEWEQRVGASPFIKASNS